MKLLTIIAIILTLFVRCQAKTEDKPEVSAEYLYLEPETTTEISEAEDAQFESLPAKPKYDQEIITSKLPESSILPEKVIRHAYLRMQVKDYAASTKLLKTYIAQSGGVIAKAEEERRNGNLENSFTIRVTDDKFEALLIDLQKTGVYLDHKNVNTRDVSAEYVDVNSRLKTKKKVEERYLALLARANTVKDILAIETELKSLQEEIEATESRQRYLQSQVAYSTIVLDYFQTIDTVTSPDNTISAQIRNALLEGWAICLYFLYSLIKLWPIWLLLILIIGLIRKYWRNRLIVPNPVNG